MWHVAVAVDWSSRHMTLWWHPRSWVSHHFWHRSGHDYWVFQSETQREMRNLKITEPTEDLVEMSQGTRRRHRVSKWNRGDTSLIHLSTLWRRRGTQY